jgi:uncharacterized OB-fold protein
MGLSESVVQNTKDRRRIDRERACLIGSRCAHCDMTSWPQRAVCPRCGAAPLRESAFGPTGTLLSHTTVWVPRPGIAPPYTLGQVHVEDGPVVFTHVRGLQEGVSVPLPVRMRVAEDPAAVPPFWFEPG